MSLRPAEVPVPTGDPPEQNLFNVFAVTPKQKKQPRTQAPRAAAQEQTPYWEKPGWRPWPAPLGAEPDMTVFNWEESDKAWEEIYLLQSRAVEVIRRILPRVHDRLEAVRPSRLLPLVQPDPLKTSAMFGHQLGQEEVLANCNAIFRTNTLYEPYPVHAEVAEGLMSPDDPQADSWNEKAARCAFVAAIELDAPALLDIVRGFPEVMEARGVGYQAPKRYNQCVAQKQKQGLSDGVSGLYCAVQEAMDKHARETGQELPPDAPSFAGESVHGSTVLFTVMCRAYAELERLGEAQRRSPHPQVQHIVKTLYETYAEAVRLRWRWAQRRWQGETSMMTVVAPVLEAGCDPFELPVAPNAPLPKRMEVAFGSGDSPLKLAVVHQDEPTVAYLAAMLYPRLADNERTIERLQKLGML